MVQGSRRGGRDRTRPDLTPEAVRVLRLFRIIFNSVRKHFRALEKKAGVSGAHVWALAVIRDHAGIGVNDLAAAMDVHQSTASNLLRTLVDQGLVTAQRDTLDKRASRLKITAKGARVLRSAPGPFTGVLPEALCELDPRALKRLEKDLHALIDALGTSARGAHVPLSAAQR
ncbi:MAG TPA: MarR family winged helix-turn-helix transcriptional regulator [Ramlibacter sp.]|uniref:MarR family winged helix-turn-helix transcriptional regulator n=1 Tax=Ramlibacter sp. TaxID=1917967 RepID=UPI002C2619EF|nr:MarR family winged helix-turn-helix transcriptional regulator [Ramlibacter sp.]HVZ44826.1 MarR family winged helix-turn-helix transcriptional regulator [Ramlibacter sp.]